MTTELPEILRGVKTGSEVRFTYTMKDGSQVYVSGQFDAMTGPSRENVTGIKVRIGVNSRIPGQPAGTVLPFALDRITPDSETGLIIPVSQAERRSGTGAARHLAPSDRQVAYALSLCNRDGDLGGGNFYRPAEQEFRAMTRPQISEWIDMAKEELGI